MLVVACQKDWHTTTTHFASRSLAQKQMNHTQLTRPPWSQGYSMVPWGKRVDMDLEDNVSVG